MSGDDGRWRQRLDNYIRIEAKPSHKYRHQPQLYALTQAIAAGTPGLAYDDDVTFAAAYLHDLGVFLGHRPNDPVVLETWDHVAYACEKAPDILQAFGFPTNKLDPVLQCIREHQPHNEPHSIEATLLRDADILEQLGATAILRTCSKIGSDTRFHLFGDATRSLAKAAESLPQQLRFDASRELAKPRTEVLHRFLAAVWSETGSTLD
jgi:uncharacterized protein